MRRENLFANPSKTYSRPSNANAAMDVPLTGLTLGESYCISIDLIENMNSKPFAV